MLRIDRDFIIHLGGADPCVDRTSSHGRCRGTVLGWQQGSARRSTWIDGRPRILLGRQPIGRSPWTDREEITMRDEPVAPETKGVATELLAAVDLGLEIEGMERRQLRMRMVTIEPGGVFGPIHDHIGRPGTVYVLQGTITDHRDGVATDYGPGVGWPEDRNTTHWLENRARSLRSRSRSTSSARSDPSRGSQSRPHGPGFRPAATLGSPPSIHDRGDALARDTTWRPVLEPVHDLADLLEAGQRADRLGYDTLWTWDHLYPIVGSSRRSDLRGLADARRVGPATEHVRIGFMVGANTFREPALTAKMATTLDHISNGRRSWASAGHGSRPNTAPTARFRERLPRTPALAREALPVMRGMLHGEAPDRCRPRYSATAVRNDPLPIQDRLPLLIGGGGEKVTLKLVARYADANNVGGGIENVRRKDGHPAPALRDGRPRPCRDRTDDRPRHGRHPRLARPRRNGSRRRSSSATGTPPSGPTSRSGPGRRGRATRPVPRHRLPTPHRRVPLAVRRGIDDRLTTEVRPLLERALFERAGRVQRRSRARCFRLGPVAADGHVDQRRRPVREAS